MADIEHAEIMPEPLLIPIPRPGQTVHGFTRDQIYVMFKAGVLAGRKFGKRSFIVGPSLREVIADLPPYAAPSRPLLEARGARPSSRRPMPALK